MFIRLVDEPIFNASELFTFTHIPLTGLKMYLFLLNILLTIIYGIKLSYLLRDIVILPRKSSIYQQP